MSIFTIKMDIESSTIINASRDEIWPFISEIEKKNLWSPWIIFERDCEQNEEGNPNELGYKTSWNGRIIGEGEEILQDVEVGKYRKNALNLLKN